MVIEYEIKQSFDKHGLMAYLVKEKGKINHNYEVFFDVAFLANSLGIQERELKERMEWSIIARSATGVVVNDDNSRTKVISYKVINSLLAGIADIAGLCKVNQVKEQARELVIHIEKEIGYK